MSSLAFDSQLVHGWRVGNLFRCTKGSCSHAKLAIPKYSVFLSFESHISSLIVSLATDSPTSVKERFNCK